MTASNPDMSATPPPLADDAFSKQIQFAPRLQSLDVLRGIAVLFAMFISVWFFGGFSQNSQNGLLISSKGFDYRLFGTIDLLFDGKMRALIAIVFGAGMLLFLSKDNKKGELQTHDLFIRRQMWLIAFGIVNGLLFFWTRDVLFHLGIMGILLFPFVRLSARGLLIAAVITTFIYSGKNYWNYTENRTTYNKYVAVTAVEKKIAKDSVNKAKAITAAGVKDSTSKKDTLTKKQAEEKGEWEGIVAGMKYGPKKDDGENKEMRATSYGSIYNHLMPALQLREAQWTYQFGIWDFASMIFLGMAIFKLGFFNNKFSRTQYLLIALIGITAGLLLGWYRLHNQQISLHDYAKYVNSHPLPHTIFFPFERGFMALGYASLVLFLLNGSALKMLWRALANVGRLAFTNYLSQSVICTLFFTGFGMGYFGRLNQYQLYLFAAELCVVQVVFSSLWLRAYHIGPAEWLWRRLIYGKRLPWRKKKPEPIEPIATALS
jgi:uncharacterized protein